MQVYRFFWGGYTSPVNPYVFVSLAPLLTSLRAVLEIVSGDSRIFSGESVRLTCSIPDVHKSTWTYLWFRESKQLPQSGKDLILWNAKVQESGKYYCQGVRDTLVGNMHTLQSLPLEIYVDGKILFISFISLEISLIHMSDPLLPLFPTSATPVNSENWEPLNSSCF